MWQRRTIFFMTVFFISGMMGVSAFADSDSETKTCKESHVPVERTNGKIVCMTERTAERTVERFGWIILDHTLGEPNKTVISDAILIQDDLIITTKQSIPDDPDSAPSDETLNPADGANRNVSCIDDVCVETIPGEQTTVETEITIHSHKVENDKFVIKEKKKSATFSFSPYFPEHVPEGCTAVDGTIKWGDRHNDSKILEDLQKEIDSGKTELCVTLVVNKKHQDNLVDFLMEQGADVEGELVYYRDGKLEKKGRSLYKVNAAVSLSLLYELADRNNVVNLDLYGKSPLVPYHITHGYDSKIISILQKEIESKRYSCTPDTKVPDMCPPLKQNKDGQYLVNVGIGLERLDRNITKSKMISKGVISESMSRGESNTIVTDEIKKQNRIIAQPIIDLLAENNFNVVYYYEPTNWITVHNIPIDFLPQLVDSDLVLIIESKTEWYAHCEYSNMCWP